MFFSKKVSPLLVFAIFFLMFSFAGMDLSYAQTKLTIGTFDSRAVIIAYANSSYFKMPSEMGAKYKEAKEKKDSVELKKLDREGKLRQAMLHEQGFGKGSVCYIMDEFKDQLKDLAVKENLALIVSKWELQYSNDSIEKIDVTEKVVGIFGPVNEKMKSTLSEMKNSEPIKEAYLLDD